MPACTTTESATLAAVKEALEANSLAMKELEKQRTALMELRDDKAFFRSDLIPYAPRIQQAVMYGAVVYTMAVGETPMMCS